jgi:deazaflavin-dependent oxidoreductase (nitroreductase family)
MSKTYQRNFAVRLVNNFMQTLIHLNLAPKGMHILTVQGRKSGRLYSTPVTLVEGESQRWLVSPYGEVPWVQNARMAKTVTLTRGKRTEKVDLVEIEPVESAPILKKYLALEPITNSYFDIGADSDEAAFVAEAPRHPVFRLRSAG